MAKQDFYDILGVSKSADADELKRAYRKLAMQYHPDRNPGDKSAEQKFKEISEAYDILKDDQKRAAYDRFGHAAFENGGGGPGGFGCRRRLLRRLRRHLRGDVRRDGRRPRAAARAARARQRSALQPRGLARGGVPRQADDDPRRTPRPTATACKGSGAEPGSRPATCRTCHGHGRVRAQQGFFTIERTCPTCQGAGPDDREAVQGLRRPGPGAAREDPVGQHPAGGRGRHPHPPRRRGRGRPARRRRRAISTSSSASRRTRSFSATAPTSFAACRSRSRRRRSAARSRCRPSRAAAPASRCRRHPIGPPVPPARQGHDACCARRCAATCTSRRSSRRRST